MTTVALVGCGATGLAIIKALQAQLQHGNKIGVIRLLVIEPSPELGKGLAYRRGIDGHIINMPVETMGFSDNAEDFHRWRLKLIPGIDAAVASSRYVSRSVYGAYLTEIAAKTIAKNSKNFIIHRVRSEATNITTSGEKYILELLNGESHTVDKVIIAVGHVPANPFKSLEHYERFIASPLQSNALYHIRPHHTVHILGASLTAIDIARSLAAQNHTGKLFFHSRSGLLPRVQGENKPYDQEARLQQELCELAKRHQGSLTWKMIYRCLMGKINAGELSTFNFRRKPVASAMVLLEQDMDDASNHRTQWQVILSATSSIAELLWQAMSITERCKFDQCYLTMWMSARHSMPLPNAQFLMGLFERQQLQVKRINSNDIEMLATTNEWIINGSGYGHDAGAMQSPFIEGLLSSGLCRLHANGGIDVKFDTLQALNHTGLPHPNIYFIGPITRGVHFYTHSVERSWAHAKRVSEHIAGELRAAHKAIRQLNFN